MNAMTAPANDPIHDWRESLLRWTLYAYVGLGAVAAIAGIWIAITERFWSIVVFDTAAWFGALALALLPARFHGLKVGGALAITYSIGVFFTVGFGPFAAGPLWLFVGPMMTGALLGWRPAVAALGVLLVTLLTIGVLLDRGSIVWPGEVGVDQWIIISGSLLALSGIASVSIGLLLEGIERAHRAREQALRAREQLEEQLRNAQKMEAVGRLAGGIAHRFNNLLLAVMGFNELAMEGLDEDHEALEDLREIAKAVDRGRGLSAQLRAFTREGVTTPQIISLNDFILDAEPLVDQFAGDDIRVALELASTPFHVRIEPDAFRQVLVHATVNAREAMPRGGLLRIRTALEQVPPESEGTGAHELRPGEYVRVSIEDTGRGIPAAELSKLFEPFFTTKSSNDASGLGLSTCWAIAQQANGHLRVRSEVDQGTTLELLLPTQPAPLAAAPDPSAPGTDRGHEAVLIVDDDEQVRRTLARSLRSRGYQVLTAGDAEEALSVIRAGDTRVDLLLTDVMMPGLTGSELARRAREIRPALLTLFVSGYSGEALSEQDILPAAVALLRKPFSKK